jgi:hypothetical protein
LYKRFYVTESVNAGEVFRNSLHNYRLLKEHPMRELPCKYDLKLPTNARFMFTIWLCYMFGSVAGTWMHSRWNVSALYLPVVILVIAAGVDQVRPLSIEEEREQA